MFDTLLDELRARLVQLQERETTLAHELDRVRQARIYQEGAIAGALLVVEQSKRPEMPELDHD